VDWHVQSGETQVGPVGESELVTWVGSGQLLPTDLVWRDGMDRWAPAWQTQPFAATFSAGTGAVIGDDPLMRAILPVGRSSWAIGAGYLGLCSLLAFPGPISVVVGVIAIVDIRRHPGKHGMGRAIFGIAMGLIGTWGLWVLYGALT